MARPRFEGAVTTPEADHEIEGRSVVGGLTSLMRYRSWFDWHADDMSAEGDGA